MVTAILKREETSVIMEPLTPIFQESIESAVTKLNAGLGSFPAMSNRTKASMLYDLVKDEIKSKLADSEDIQIIEKWSSITIMIKNQVAARVKKLNSETGRPANIKTKRIEAIIDQQQLSLFPEYPTPTHICIGYVINDTWTEVKSLKIVCLYKDSVAWPAIDITRTSVTETEPFITNEEQVAPRVTPKKKQANN
jgi:hypothetical protein